MGTEGGAPSNPWWREETVPADLLPSGEASDQIGTFRGERFEFQEQVTAVLDADAFVDGTASTATGRTVTLIIELESGGIISFGSREGSVSPLLEIDYVQTPQVGPVSEIARLHPTDDLFRNGRGVVNSDQLMVDPRYWITPFLKFPIADLDIPEDAQVDSVRLVLHENGNPSGVESIYRVFTVPAAFEWDEGFTDGFLFRDAGVDQEAGSFAGLVSSGESISIDFTI